MACMEHQCPDCDYHEFDNSTLHKCPKCGSTRISNFWDEQSLHEREEREKEEENWKEDTTRY